MIVKFVWRKEQNMQKITVEDAKNIQGGLSFWVGAGIVGIGIFLAGVLDGFTRPLRCN